ncbi:MAG: glutamine--fructose-6-phosphate transaminase (isomerizing) [Chlamydiae bacterium]|nr:glutamine--fructose-6-phosphate transaminase (isomerizing) [Chlamydiota bacterium]
MCGIFGYVGTNTEENPVDICLEGLRYLEYRGYDSAGIAGILDGKINACKTAGRVHDLEALIRKSELKLSIAIAHTRWATHGKPSSYNAHPHFDSEHQLAIVHNGIIENYAFLKEELIKQGIVFHSDTDTEVIAQLLSFYYKGDVLSALRKTLQQLEGTWAIALIHKKHPDQIFAATKDAPLVVGYGTKEIFLSSDPNALKKEDLDILYLQNQDIAILQADSVKIVDLEGKEKITCFEKLHHESSGHGKDNFEHFMLKEIFEQPLSIKRAMENRLNEYLGTAYFEDLTLSLHELQSINRILILGCGTSYHAGCIAAALLQNIARIPTEVDIASEFRYSDPILSEDTLVIAISQSGETADTLAAVQMVRAKKAKVLGICNVKNSKLARESDSCLFLRAGPEVSVCSTKAFTSQLTLLGLFTLFMARLRHLSKEAGQQLLHELKSLPSTVEKVLSQARDIHALAKKYAHHEHFFFIGRRYMYPTSLEAALKLKEISYLNAIGYPAGELKHGPIALIDENHVTVAMCGNAATYTKLVSNLMEIKARGGPLIAFAPRSASNLETIADDILYLPEILDPLASIPYSIAAQLFAYYIAKEKGTDIDKPRNLAKSVTVE